MSRKRQRTCGGKRRFRDRAEALRSIQRMGNWSQRQKVPVRAYECPRCKGYHLTSRAER